MRCVSAAFFRGAFCALAHSDSVLPLQRRLALCTSVSAYFSSHADFCPFSFCFFCTAGDTGVVDSDSGVCLSFSRPLDQVGVLNLVWLILWVVCCSVPCTLALLLWPVWHPISSSYLHHLSCAHPHYTHFCVPFVPHLASSSTRMAMGVV